MYKLYGFIAGFMICVTNFQQLWCYDRNIPITFIVYHVVRDVAHACKLIKNIQSQSYQEWRMVLRHEDNFDATMLEEYIKKNNLHSKAISTKEYLPACRNTVNEFLYYVENGTGLVHENYLKERAESLFSPKIYYH